MWTSRRKVLGGSLVVASLAGCLGGSSDPEDGTPDGPENQETITDGGMNSDADGQPSPAALPAPSRLPQRSGLPDPFETLDGSSVETQEEWRDRRAELERLFRHYVYGYAPEAPEIETSVERTEGVLDGAATLVETTIEFVDLPDDAPTITMVTFLPADADGPAPVFLAGNIAGNHATVADEAVTITDVGEQWGARERGVRREHWSVEHVLSRGYALATYHVADLDPDVDDFGNGIHPYFDDELPGPPGSQWGTIAAWAWGLHRCVDALQETDGVDGDRIAVTGHSRRGKTALLAGATDERIALVAPHQSGTGGTVPARENDQETVADVTNGFPHWFADTYAAFGGRPDRLPIDQHLLVAMVAPRPLIATDGSNDDWANPDRALDCLQAAAPVWDFLDADGMVDDGLLQNDDDITADTAGDLCQYRRPTEHVLDREYWDAILDFADLHLRT